MSQQQDDVGKPATSNTDQDQGVEQAGEQGAPTRTPSATTPAATAAEAQPDDKSTDDEQADSQVGAPEESQPKTPEALIEERKFERVDDGRGATMVSVSLDEDRQAAARPVFAKCGDLESGGAARVQKPPAYLSLRYYIMLLALVSPFIVTYSRTIINFAIIDMIDPNYLRSHTGPNVKQPIQVTATATTAAAATTTTTTTPSSIPDDVIASMLIGNQTGDPLVAARQLDYFDLDNSCPVDETVRTRLLRELANDERRATETEGEKFQWDTDKQGYLKAAYAIGHMLLQVVGGRLSEIYGSQFIMSISACLMALCCLSAPFLASLSFYLLFSDLFVLGILGSFMTPSLITLIANWLTPGEKSLMMSFYLVSSRLGYALSSLLCGLLIDAQLSWRYLFYSAGWVSLAFGNVFFLCARNRPQEHPFISESELNYLASKNTLVREALVKRKAEQVEETELKSISTSTVVESTKQANGVGHQQAEGNENDQARAQKKRAPKQGPGAPWLAILTNAPVWAFIVTKFCVKLMGDTVQTELPVYLKRVMHMESKYNGYINSANYVIFCFSCVLVGTLAKWANKQRPFGWTKTTVRKIFQCTASFGVGLVLLAVSMSVCNETATLGLFMAMFVLTTFSTGGEAQLPLDLSERYAGTIHALGGTLAISGAIEPIIVGQFLLGHSADKSRWTNIWLAASSISFLGGLMFLVLGEAKIQPFDKIVVGGKGNEDSSDERMDDARQSRANGHQIASTVAPIVGAPEEEQQQQQQKRTEVNDDI